MFEILEHTADIGFRATASSLPKLFESAAEALVATAIEVDNIEPRDSYALSAEGDSCESLLVNWLNEVLYYMDGRRLAMHSFTVRELTSSHVSGESLGELRNPERHPGRLIIKGITYHQLKVAENQAGWFCEVYLDI